MTDLRLVIISTFSWNNVHCMAVCPTFLNKRGILIIRHAKNATVLDFALMGLLGPFRGSKYLVQHFYFSLAAYYQVSAKRPCAGLCPNCHLSAGSRPVLRQTLPDQPSGLLGAEIVESALRWLTLNH